MPAVEMVDAAETDGSSDARSEHALPRLDGDEFRESEVAEPLLHAAALALASGDTDSGRRIAAAKAAVGETSYTAARTALRLPGAVGYTDELDLFCDPQGTPPVRRLGHTVRLPRLRRRPLSTSRTRTDA
ncbi:acyl-CoA dehydrogenase family protein [Streptomyces turgidiscabies]|uniref:acyl-CoA dehydrogenase family protein n=1 Tax=Streptomyces TaxID=1883 RepID=UPI0015C4F30B